MPARLLSQCMHARPDGVSHKEREAVGERVAPVGRKGEEGEWSSGISVANSPWHACGGKSKPHARGWCEMMVIKEHTDTHAVRA